MEFFTFSVPKNPVSRGNLENFPNLKIVYNNFEGILKYFNVYNVN